MIPMFVKRFNNKKVNEFVGLEKYSKKYVG